MPRGNPRKLTAIRLPPDLLEAVQEHTSNVTQAVEEGLRLWLAQQRRKAVRTARAESGPYAMPLPPGSPKLGGKR